MPLAAGQTAVAKLLCGLEKPSLPLCMPPGPPFTLVEELGTASGLAAGALSCEREVPLSARLWKMLWCPGTCGRASPLLLPPVWSTAPCTAAHQLAQAPLAGGVWQLVRL